MKRLTDKGLALARREAPTSVVAAVALAAHYGEANDWPEPFRLTSIEVMNEQAGR